MPGGVAVRYVEDIVAQEHRQPFAQPVAVGMGFWDGFESRLA